MRGWSSVMRCSDGSASSSCWYFWSCSAKALDVALGSCTLATCPWSVACFAGVARDAGVPARASFARLQGEFVGTADNNTKSESSIARRDMGRALGWTPAPTGHYTLFSGRGKSACWFCKPVALFGSLRSMGVCDGSADGLPRSQPPWRRARWGHIIFSGFFDPGLLTRGLVAVYSLRR